jgi:hypothetical protein
MNNYLDMMRTQVGRADRTDDPSAVQYGILLALASIAESLATLATNAADEAREREIERERAEFIAEAEIRKATARNW